MFAVKFTTVSTVLLTTLALSALAFSAGCRQSETLEQQVSPQPTVTGIGKTLNSGMGYSISNLKEPPADVQDFVDRSHAVVIGTIAAVSSPSDELPFNKTADEYPSEDVENMRLRVTYYDITIEEVLLDDGFVSNNARLRLDGDHSLIRPQVGEKFVFSLARNPGNKNYGVMADWMVLTTADGVKNYDGTSPGYKDIVDEASLLRAIRTAAQSYSYKGLMQWPSKP